MPRADSDSTSPAEEVLPVDDALELLATVTADRWDEEAKARGLVASAPAMVRWAWADEEVAVPDEEIQRHIAGDRMHIPGPTAEPESKTSILTAGLITDLYQRLYRPLARTRGRVVLLGGPGSGKTSMMLLLLRQILASRNPGTDEPVPVWLTLGGWKPTDTPLQTWAAAAIARDNPFLSSSQVAGFLAAGQIALFLDGLDEMPAKAQGPALEAIRKDGRGLAIVLTSRRGAYERALATGQLTFAAVIELLPPDDQETRLFLVEGQVGERRKAWLAVAEYVRKQPGSPAGIALTTPLMLMLARETYALADPRELIRPEAFENADAVRRHLIGRFLDLVYTDERERKQAFHWLSWIASQMGSNRDLSWWTIPRWVPEWQLGAVTALPFIPAIALLEGGIAWLGFGLAVGIAVGIIMGVLFGGAAGFLGLSGDPALIKDSGPIALTLRRPRLKWMSSRQRALRLSLGIAGAGTLVLLTLFVLNVRHESITWGVAVQIAVVVILLIVLSVAELPALHTSVALLRTPTPSDAYLADRRRFVVVQVSIWLSVGPGAAVAWYIWYFLARSLPLDPSMPRVVGFVAATLAAIGIPLVFGTSRGFGPAAMLEAVGVLVLFKSWGRDQTRFLPLLESALHHQVLRRAGTVYQFRHAELQDYLAERAQVTVLPPAVHLRAPEEDPSPDTAPSRQLLVLLRAEVDASPMDAAARRRLGDESLRAGLVDEAETAYASAIHLCPDDPLAHLGAAEAYRARGWNWNSQALAKYRDAIRLDPQDASIQNAMGVFLLGIGRADQATAFFQRSIELEPRDASSHRGLARALAEQDDLPAAEAHYRKAIELDPDDGPSHRGLGDVLMRQRPQWERSWRKRYHHFVKDRALVRQATAAYRQAIRVDRDDLAAHRGLAKCYRGWCNPTVLREIVRLDPTASSYRELGEHLTRAGEFEEAEATLRTAIRQDPDHAEGHLELAKVLQRRGQLREAADVAREALRLARLAELAVVAYDCRRVLADTLDELIEKEGANASHYDAAELGPQLAQLYSELGGLRLALDQVGFAAVAYQSAIRFHETAAAYRGLGDVRVQQRKFQAAHNAYLTATRLNSRDAVAHERLGEALLSLERPRDAEISFLAALDLDPTNMTLYKRLGDALIEQGREADAGVYHRLADSQTQALTRYELRQQADRHARALIELGHQLIFSDHHEEAITAYREAIYLNPNDAIAHKSLGVTLCNLGRFAEAEAPYRRAIEIDPNYAGAHTGLGHTLWRLGRSVEAEAAYRRAIEIDPNYAGAHTGLGHTLCDLGRFVEAEAPYRRAIELDPDDVIAHTGLGIALWSLGRFVEAEAAYRRAIELDPDDAGAHGCLGGLLLFTGDSELAQVELAQAGALAYVELLRWVAVRPSSQDEVSPHTPDSVLAALSEPWPPKLFRRSVFAEAQIRALAFAGQGDGTKAVRTLRSAVDGRRPADRFVRPLYDLLALPEPVAGLEGLVEVWREIIAVDPSAAGPWGGPDPA